MNNDAKQQINEILVTSLSIIEDAQNDLTQAYEGGNVTDYYAALQRFALASRGCKDVAEAVELCIATGQHLKEAK